MVSIQDLLNPEVQLSPFFENVPDEVLENIVRELYRCVIMDAVQLTQITSLKRVFGRLISRMHFIDYKDRITSDSGVILAGMKNSLSDFECILQELNPNIREITLGVLKYQKKDEAKVAPHVEKMAELIVRYCPDVRELRIMPNEKSPFYYKCIEILLRGFGHQLVDLEITGFENESLQYMEIIGLTCTSLKKLLFIGYSLKQLSELMPVLGYTLKEINICLVDGHERNWDEMIAVLEKDCRQLTTILLDNPLEDNQPVGESEYVSFLCSYGKQLKSANVLSMSAYGCSRLARECPNVECVLNEIDLNYERLVALNTRLHTLSIRIPWYEVQPRWSGMKNTFAKCNNLTNLTVETDKTNGTVYENWVLPMFTHKQERLETFEIRSGLVLSVSKLHIIANATRRLKSLFLTFDSLENANVFNSLITNNPNLKTFDMCTMKGLDEGTAYDVAEEIATKFSMSKNFSLLNLYFGTKENGEEIYLDRSKMILPQKSRRIKYIMSTRLPTEPSP